MKKLPYLLIPAVCIAAAILGHFFPIPGGPVIAMLLGIALAPFAAHYNIVSMSQKISKKALLWAVVMLGLGLDIHLVGNLGRGTWGFMVLTVCFGLLVTGLLAKRIGLRGPVALLLAVGTSICGGSAIAAVAGVSKAREEETAQALSTIFLYNILAAILFPLVGRALGMNAEYFGMWAGTAINDTSSVLAATFAYGAVAGAVGMQVKMARTLMILPVSLGVALWMRHQGKVTGSWKKVLPLPAMGFGAALLIRFALPDAPPEIWHIAGLIGQGLMILALACIGLVSHLGKMWRTGKRAFLAGGLGWIALALFSYGIHF
jgi:uncharacterized integral membrane protein (TIGR00698 family)